MRSKHLPGEIPGSQFVDTGDPFGSKVGVITRVDELNMKADVRIVTGGGDRYEIDLTQGMAGPRSFWGGVPEVGSFVFIGYRRIRRNLHDAYIIGYLPTGTKSGIRFDPFAPDDPSTIDEADKELFEQYIGTTRRIKRLLLRPGEVGGMSASGSEFVLGKSAKITNRAGDLFELRDVDRTLISQSIHRVEADSGIKRVSGPIRRGGFFLPPDILQSDGLTLKTEKEGYYGRDELQATGPSDASKLADPTGKLSEIFNNFTEFPAVTYANGRRVHYPPTSPAVSIEDPDGPADAFTESRMELAHTSDLSEEVLEEIDGYGSDHRVPFIEQVFGTLVGNDLTSVEGQRLYGRVLKPRLFTDFTSRDKGKFKLEEVDRTPTSGDIEAYTSAGAVLLRVRPPRGTGDSSFVASVSKQGKLHLNIPGSKVEDYASGVKNISAELNLEGALKAYIGASNPDRVSAHITCEGGVVLDIGRDSSGNAVTTRFHSATKTVYEGNPNSDDAATSLEVRGVKETAISGAERKTIEGTKSTVVSGMYQIQADRVNLNTFGGFTLNAGQEMNVLVAGKTQANYALAVLETIALGGKTLTILAGGLIQTILAGAAVYNTVAGATTFTNPAGAFSVTVGAGALALSTGAGAVTLSTGAGAVSISAGAGAISLTAGLAMNLTAGAAISMIAPQILLGGPPAVLGVCRGVPALPPGTPTLDYLTGAPMLGSAMVRSI